LSIERIFIRPPGGNPTIEQESVRVVAGAGIEGDRYFIAHDEPGQNVTFVEAEAIEAFALEHRRPLDLSVTGRNVVTRGIRLNELVGREFIVGSVRFRGVELCEPCLTLGEALATPTLPPAGVVKHWVHRGGLRADALSSGELSVGAGFKGAA
jgi:MOSC domain-containing protein YiiM